MDQLGRHLHLEYDVEVADNVHALDGRLVLFAIHSYYLQFSLLSSCLFMIDC